MPYLMVQTNLEFDKNIAQGFVDKASTLVADLLGKSQNYVMVSLQPPSLMSFAGDAGPTAYVELKSIGLPENKTNELSNALCTLIHDELKIEKQRVYIEFSNANNHLWGWNGGTF
jgi:phenylpyruvate tautomerase